MKQEMRKQLAQLPFEEKVRKVGELIRLARKVKSHRAREDPGGYPQSIEKFTRPGRRGEKA